MGNGIGVLAKIAFVALVAMTCGCKRETPQTAPTTNTTIAPGGDALVSGSVIFNGTPPPPRTIVMDSLCGKLHTNAPTEADYRIGTASGLADVFVYLQGVPDGVGATPEGD